MQLGLQLHPFDAGKHGNPFDTALAVSRACEQAGLDSVWMADHFMFPDEKDLEREVPVMECFVALGAIAALTSRIRLGELVVGVPYRNPPLVAKMCATLDVISHGRSIVGLGAGCWEPEFAAYGWPYPAVRERMQMLDEAVQIVDLMLKQRPVSFRGKHYSVRDALNDPMPVQKPRPPIVIGGSGERVTLRLVARYADMCNVFGDPATVARKFDVLCRHCEEVGRPFDEVTRSNFVDLLIARDDVELKAKKERHPDFDGIAGTPDTVIAGLKEYADAGSQCITLHMPDAADLEPILLLGEKVVPAVARL
ncbi:MAG: TIGR03560 family F420-dependent LLM class oxidoreductase [Chloroflexota bacterium]|nr:TIGR03560 family F420-dependent LLM class oxidoreductase [Chloroflexota bacterium]